MPGAKPPFRADHVGSLLRPPQLIAARKRHLAGEIDAGELKAVEDDAIRAAVAMQEALGLKAVTDGEYRRSFWHLDFIGGLDGVDLVQREEGAQFHDRRLRPTFAEVTGKVDYTSGHMVDHFAFLKSEAAVTPKMTIPSPSAVHFRGGRAAISRDAYPDLDAFWDDLAAAYGKVIRAFGEAGCTYLQLDEVFIAYLCDPKMREEARRLGGDPDALPAIYARMINRALRDRPEGMTVAMHLCRGNFRSSWVADGGYEPVAELLFNEIGVDAYFMEYDSPRAGSFEPLRYLPKDKHVVLGLITSKTGELESAAEVKRRIDEAARFAPLDQLAVSPQCGFASTEEGNLLTYDQQRAKLGLVVDVARDVWGDL